MTYTKRRFGAELILQLEDDLELERDFDSTRISKWANKIHFDHSEEADDELIDAIRTLGAMSFGPEFDFTREQLLKIAIDCILSKDNQNAGTQQEDTVVYNGIYFERGAQNLSPETVNK